MRNFTDLTYDDDIDNFEMSMLTADDAGEIATYLTEHDVSDAEIGRLLVHMFHDRAKSDDEAQRLYTLVDDSGQSHGVIAIIPDTLAHHYVSGLQPEETDGFLVKRFGVANLSNVESLLTKELYSAGIDAESVHTEEVL